MSRILSAAIGLPALAMVLAACQPAPPPTTTPELIIQPARQEAVPAAAKATQEKLLAAAKARDLAAIANLLKADSAKFDFGDAKDPVAYWARLKADGVDVAADLERVLMMRPGATLLGEQQVFVWPYLFALEPKDLTGPALDDYKALAPPGWDPATDASFKDQGYLGWRVLISPDGKIAAFVRGD